MSELQVNIRVKLISDKIIDQVQTGIKTVAMYELQTRCGVQIWMEISSNL